MEKDDEVKGVTGSSYDYSARMYDSRLGRWMSTDPKFREQPGWSTYKAFLDNPIIYQDPDGETEFLSVVVKNKSTGKALINTKVMSGDLAPSAGIETVCELRHYLKLVILKRTKSISLYKIYGDFCILENVDNRISTTTPNPALNRYIPIHKNKLFVS